MRARVAVCLRMLSDPCTQEKMVLMSFFFLHVLHALFLLDMIKRIAITPYMKNSRTYAALTPNAALDAAEHDGAYPAQNAEYHLALALRCVEAFIREADDNEDNEDNEDDMSALEALAQGIAGIAEIADIADMQAPADLPGPEP